MFPYFYLNQAPDGHLEYSVPIHLIVVAYSLSDLHDWMFSRQILTSPNKLRLQSLIVCLVFVTIYRVRHQAIDNVPIQQNARCLSTAVE